MSLIGLQFETQDPYFQKLAKQYWQTNSKDKFSFKINELSIKYQLSPRKLLAYVNDSAKAYLKDYACHLCGTPTSYLYRRADFHEVIKAYRKWKLWGRNTPHLCTDCEEAMHQHRHQKQEKTQRKSQIQSIFPTLEALAVYKKLRQRHYFVYPQIALRSFAPQDVINSFCKTEWQKNFVAQFAADFVVCDAKGYVEKVIRLSSTTPLSEIEQEEFDFLKRFLHAMDVSLQDY